MSLTIEQLAEEALALPANARAQLLDRLVESLDPAEDVPFRELWAAEALRRRDEVRAGRVQTVPGVEALKLARQAASE
jgi:putative addiction module component (TIGR02574 family)